MEIQMSDSRHEGPPVLVTGATGYVAGWIVKQLLDEGSPSTPPFGIRRMPRSFDT
jgi:nucleoside-diphosphate-sugar epimerase